MATTRDVLLTEFRAAGQGNVIQAFNGIAMASTAMTAAAAAAALVTGSVVALGVQAIRTAGQFERFQTRMDTVFGSVAKGKEAFAWAKQFAQETPYQLSEVIEQMTQMQAMSLNPFQDMKSIGDAASALGLGAEGVQRIVLQLGQMRAVRHATMMDLRPLMQAGIPVFDILQEQLGIAKERLGDIGNLGLDAQTTINALMRGMDRRFGGAMAAQMDTLIGKVSNMKDAWERMMANIGDALLPSVKHGIEQITKMLEDPRTVAGALRFVSYIVAGFETSKNLLTTMMGTLFTGDDAPKWVLQMEKSAITIMEAFMVIKGLQGGMSLGKIFAGGKGGIIGAILGALAGAGAAKLAERHFGVDDLDARIKNAKTPGIRDIIESSKNNFGKTADDYYKQWLGTSQGGPLKALAKFAANSLNPAGGQGNAAPSVVEQFILGGGDRLRKGIGGLDMNRRMLGNGAPVITIKVESGDNSPLGKALQDMAHKFSTLTLRELLGDPRGRAALKAALTD